MTLAVQAQLAHSGDLVVIGAVVLLAARGPFTDGATAGGHTGLAVFVAKSLVP